MCWCGKTNFAFESVRKDLAGVHHAIKFQEEKNLSFVVKGVREQGLYGEVQTVKFRKGIKRQN